LFGAVLDGGDALVRLNDAFHPDAVVVDVPAGVRVDAPLVIVHFCDGETPPEGPRPAVFPRTVVRLGEGASASVVEVVAGAPGGGSALVVPVTELSVGDNARLAYVSLQVLGAGAWHLGRQAARAGRDASLAMFNVGLGAAYDRCRTDGALVGSGGSSQLRSAYFGSGEQVHDVRTLQDHAAPRTTSDLLCRGAVAGASRSVYSGLIRVRRGAVRTEAMQTNNNLVLDERAHADSVPNLDIEENDVRCSHASTVGPVDEDQRYYLESRGVPPERAEQLIVLGFFDDIVTRSPVPEVVGRLRREVGLRLTDALGIGLRGPGGDDGG
jgi:Fe-S cluster assembly protein SufD